MSTPSPTSYDYYPHITRNILRLFANGQLSNVTAIDVEPDYGYISRLTYINGTCRIVFGYSLGVNGAAAHELAKDKGYAKFILRTIGVNCPKGSEFLLPWWYEEIGRPQRASGNPNVRTVADVPRYVDKNLNYPIYVKPVDGSRGESIFVAESQADLPAIFEEYETKRVRVAVIEEAVTMPDYRIVCLDGQLICAYRRVPFTVVGDGKNTVGELIVALEQHFKTIGRDTNLDLDDPRLQRYMQQRNIRLNAIPAPGEDVILVPISNLSAGGSAEDVTSSVNKRWVELAGAVARNFNLRLIGLDLACADITAADVDYSVIEVNGSPGLDHYASSGDIQRKIVDDLYVTVLNAFPNV